MARTFSTIWLVAWGLVTLGSLQPSVALGPSQDQLTELQGKWIVRSCRHDGRIFPPLQGVRVQFHEQDMILMLPNELIKASLRVDTVDGQQTLDCQYILGTDKGRTRLGVYAFHEDYLYLCLGPLDGPRPKDLSCRRGSNRLLLVLQRENPHEWDLAR